MDLLEPGLAFIEGLALIASPCILPVLPLILSASAEGGRRRPFGIITGFVLSFSLFALASRQIVALLGIDVDVIKNASLVLLLAFGLVLLSKTLSEKFSRMTQKFANAGNLAQSGGNGYFSGVVVGALIGLVWTPCAGPILAAVLVQVIRQQTNIEGIFVTLSFAIGAGIPMLVIALTGRKILSKAGFLTHHAETVRKAFGGIIILSVFYIAFGASLFPVQSAQITQLAEATKLEEPVAKPYPAPEFTGIEEWLNSKPLTMASLKGKVVLVDFWTYSCINCIRTLPYITAWDKKYRDKGLVIIGVHAPEFEFEKKADNVKDALKEHGIKYPVALDNNLETWDAFKNRYWPAHYLIDKNGMVVSTHFGEGEYAETENNIRFLLGIKGTDIAAMPEGGASAAMFQTPETYVGYNRSKNYAGSAVVKNTGAAYHFPESLAVNNWALDGKWNVSGEKITAESAGAALRLHFRATKVFLVLGTASGKSVTAHISLNGAALKDIKVDKNKLYALVDQKMFAPGVVEIKAAAPGLEAYAFTFGQ